MLRKDTLRGDISDRQIIKPIAKLRSALLFGIFLTLAEHKRWAFTLSYIYIIQAIAILRHQEQKEADRNIAIGF